MVQTRPEPPLVPAAGLPALDSSERSTDRTNLLSDVERQAASQEGLALQVLFWQQHTWLIN